jgi:hypothetical protein
MYNTRRVPVNYQVFQAYIHTRYCINTSLNIVLKLKPACEPAHKQKNAVGAPNSYVLSETPIAMNTT